MPDDIKEWYKIIGEKSAEGKKMSKDFKKHRILPASLICMIGGSGAGKTTALIELLNRYGSKFYSVMVYSGSGYQEPLYQYLAKTIEDIEMYDTLEDMPYLRDIDDDPTQEKIIIFDDFINSNNKEMKKISDYFIAGRKRGFTVICLSQNYTSIPKTITRNANYFFIFKLNDKTSLNTIIKNHNIHDIPTEDFKELYNISTEKKGDFLMIDLKGSDKRYSIRHNFLDPLL